MADKVERKARAERSALAIAERLARLRPPELTERQWCAQAGVSPSFFSNLRGTPTKPPSDPSVDGIRSVLDVIGMTPAEFFALEPGAGVITVPSVRALEQAIADALPGMPLRTDRRAQYLAEAVSRVLALPPDRPATSGETSPPATDDPAEAAPPRAATN